MQLLLRGPKSDTKCLELFCFSNIFPSVQQDIIYEHQWFEVAGATFFSTDISTAISVTFCNSAMIRGNRASNFDDCLPRSFSRFRPQNFHRTFLRETLWSGLFLFKFWTKVFFQGIVCYSTVIDVFVQRWPLPTTFFPKFRDRKYKKTLFGLPVGAKTLIIFLHWSLAHKSLSANCQLSISAFKCVKCENLCFCRKHFWSILTTGLPSLFTF